MASIVKRGQKYSVVVYQSGKRHWISGFNSWTEANLKKHELEHQLDTGTYIKPGKLTLGEYLKRWLEDTVKPNLAPSTYEGYRIHSEVHIIPVLGRIPLSKLTSTQIQAFYADKQKVSPQTAIHCFNALRAALNVAITQGLLIRNPCVGVVVSEPEEPEMQTLDECLVKTVLDAARDSQWYEVFYTAIYTGMRRSELLGLKWGDISFELAVISVRRSLHLVQKEFIAREPKRDSRRLVDLTPSNVAVLKRLLERQKANSLLSETPVNADTWVFCDIYGKPLLPSSVTHAWLKLAKKLKISVRFHDLRHTHATLLLKQGVHPKVVQERLGHKLISTTMDKYSHVMPGIQRKAVKRFDKSLRR